MKKQNLLSLLLVAGLLLTTVITLTSVVSADGAVNVSVSILKNGTVMATTNTSVYFLNFTIIATALPQGANVTLDIDGNVAMICNSSVATGVNYTTISPGANVSSCAINSANTLWVNFTEGKHTIRVNVNSSKGYTSTSNYSGGNESFFVNNFASLAWASGVWADYLNLSRDYITVNATANTIAARTVHLSLYEYYSGSTFLENVSLNSSSNITYFTNRSDNVATTNMTVINWTWNATKLIALSAASVSDNWYVYNLTIVDGNVMANGQANYSYSIIRHVILDTVAPNKSRISCTGWTSVEDLTITKDATLSCTCIADEDNSTSLTYTYGPSSTPSTAAVGLFGVSCFARDHAGNNGTGSSALNYYVIESTSDTGSPGGGSSSVSGGGTSVTPAQAQITGTTNSVSAQQVSTGTTANLAANDGFRITFKPSSAAGQEQHTVKVSAVTETTATIIVASDPISFTMSIGEERKVDVDGDGTYDLLVTLNSITSGKANVGVKQISEPVPATEPIEEGSNVWTWSIAIVVIVIILIVVGLSLKGKGKRKK